MTRRTFLALVSTSLCVLSLASLVSGADWLGTPLLRAFPLPLGNLVAAILYASLATLPLLATRAGTLARVAARILLSAAVLWLPVSIGLAGNLNLNFSSARGELWSWYSFVVLPGGSLLLLLSQLIRRVLARWKRKAEPDRASLVTGNRP